MPAAPSSLTDPAIGQLLTTAQAMGGARTRLLPVLAAVPDPRARRGVRHRLAVILSLAVCAVLAGARSFTAIAEWAADADQATRDALGVTGVVPSESTFRRTLQNLDADALDDAAGAWAQQRTAPAPGARRMIAVDGKTLRGSGLAGGPVKGNQPGVHAQLAALPWRQVPVADQASEQGHGRAERRTLKVTAVAAGLAFPHAAQAIRIVRRRRPLNSTKWSAETVYAITSLTAIQARPADPAGRCKRS
jgi:hypothetical protein